MESIKSEMNLYYGTRIVRMQDFNLIFFNFVRAEMIANSQQRRRHLRQTSFSFFLERASTSNFCCASNQNNPHIPKYVLYDRSHLLQLCGKLFSWAPPVPLENFYLLAPPPRRNFHWPSVGGVWIFFGITHSILIFQLHVSMSACTCM